MNDSSGDRAKQNISRRTALLHGAAGVAAGIVGTATTVCSRRAEAADGTPPPTQAPVDRIRSVELATIFRGRPGADGKPQGTTWFSTRACIVPGSPKPTALMLMCEITGSDYFGPTHETLSSDGGATWSTPRPVPGLGRTPLGDAEGTEITVCDMVPEFHTPTGAVLAMGHDVFYRGGHFFRDQPPRHTVYIVRSPEGAWSPLKRLAWDDPRGAFIYTCNCAQRVTLPDGDVLVPLSFGPKSAGRSVAVVRCAYDGRELTVRHTSNELEHNKGRGLLEPSLVQLDGKCYLTIRAEDDRGYVSTSDDDGRTWSPQQPWTFDDGEPLVTSTTQQRWMTLGGELYLVYVRKDAANANVIRWRAPLYCALVDRRTLRLVRATERIVIPMSGDGVDRVDDVAHLGNFHVTPVTNDEAWITVGEVLPKTWRGDVILARVRS
jgi:hypothetical protein